MTTRNSLPFEGLGAVREMKLPEIAAQMEHITSWIEAERVEEREARRVYQVVADRVNERIDRIKAFGQELMREQARRMQSFDGLLGTQTDVPPDPFATSPRTPKKNISEAIVAVWALPDYDEPLTTEEIAEALPDVGYESKAAPRSLKSSLNQALAKLCRDGRVARFRMDGSIIDANETKARARKYMLTSMVNGN